VACFPPAQVYDHGGYELPLCPLDLIPFSGYVDAHTFHHTRNVECYSLYFPWLWDFIMGTDKGYKAYVVDEAAMLNATQTQTREKLLPRKSQ
jgi:hypothetical protein